MIRHHLPGTGRAALTGVAGLLLMLLSACQGPFTGQAESRGTIVFSIGTDAARTIVPDIDMTPDHYRLQGVGPGGATFEIDPAAQAQAVSELVAGDWSITAEAVNADGMVIGVGSSSATVVAGATSSVSIIVVPVTGTGTLDLTLSWPPDELPEAEVTAELVPPVGAARPLPFSVGSGTATLVDAETPSGYHTLVLSLRDNGAVVAGAVEVVRIVAGATTSGVVTFEALNDATGAIDVSVTPRLDDPLDVTMSGTSGHLAPGEAMNVAASVPGYSGNVVYTWYVNGRSVATGDRLAVGADLADGSYRLDVAAVTADGNRAGSATHRFTVGPLMQADLAWAANGEADLAGYRVHYGTSSRTYTASHDAGMTPSYSVTGLRPGETYYFAVTAYDEAGMESAYSDELTYTAP